MNFLFDLYGTLIDIHTIEVGEDVWRPIATLLGEDASLWDAIQQEYRGFCAAKRKNEEQELDLLTVFCEMCARHSGSLTPEEFATAFRRISMRRLRLFPRVKEMLQDLKAAGAGVYLLSNAQACFTNRELWEMGLTPCFDGVLLSSDVGWKKPSKQIFEVARDKFGLSFSDCIYVGNDLRDDVLGATRVGIPSVYIPTPQSGVYEGMPEPTYTVQNHGELYDLLLGLAKQ